MHRVRLILVGGFLGVGKTTLLAQAARRLAQRGSRVGLITNDQAANLVDTAILAATGSAVQEVAGGCFCCRFTDLTSAMDRLMAEEQPDVLIGEPVGSCTDVSATVLQPLKRLCGDRFRVAPFSVLVDATQMYTSAGAHQAVECAGLLRFPADVLYIHRKQLEEADVIVLNKADRLSAGERAEVEDSLAAQFPGTPLRWMSALSGEGVDAWLDFVTGDRPAGHTILEVDYDRYARGEAALGWLNAAVHLKASTAADWKAFVLQLLIAIRNRVRLEQAEIAHLKAFLSAGGQNLVANLTGNDQAPSIRGTIDVPSAEAMLLLNARVHTEPDLLQAVVVEECLRAGVDQGIRMSISKLDSFSPARPQPTHRFAMVV